ncbi:hypothetical protein COCHEDRAFT_17282 [Bipolaris maydis C5]|uniref:Uncharacterized protein n=1 Tax=Cochliobolus heterostrophus (strain C5 / ATCC 48332 / race O) TaxID=701091 RepID=M2U5W5_COCH5|nr:hypothetical protein COCHEDRAFT_17282 [Bipolaris maydis C5]KAJ6209388.1 hypothetical protein PSV09DRAFT_17282 [Bipolaris maydis]KAJ6282332.1 hypothetical protein J3E71DRAFT_379618 [Bipolaris maydis]
MKPSPLLPLALPSLATASTITLTATLCSSTANQDLTPFTINLPTNNLTPLVSDPDSAICQLSITSTSSDLDPNSVSCTVYAPTLNPSLSNPLPSTLSLHHAIENARVGSALCTALPAHPFLHLTRSLFDYHAPSTPRSAGDPSHTGSPMRVVVEKRHTQTLYVKREARPVNGDPASPAGEGGSKPMDKPGDGKKEEVGEQKREEAVPTSKEKREEAVPTSKEKREEAVPTSKEKRAEAVPTSKEKRAEAVPTSKEKREEAVPTSKEKRAEAVPTSKEKREEAVPTSKEKREEAVPTSKEKREAAPTGNTGDKKKEEKRATEGGIYIGGAPAGARLDMWQGEAI